MPELLISIPLAKLKPSPLNPRKHLGDPAKLTDLAASMKEHGVLEPVIARQAPRGAYELVCGHRRLAAAKEAGLEGVPAIVRELTDDQVLDIQIIENSQREDVHPLDEALAFSQAVERGRSVSDIADKIGRPSSFVAQRLQLLKLGKECRKALDSGKISLAVAQYIARIPDQKLQAEALDDIDQDSYDGPVTADAARKLIEERYMLRLGDAPFDITDAKLVAKAGACNSCPKRTGNQAQLFADVKNADLCTDPACFKAKKVAILQIRVKAAKESGQAVLEGKEAQKALAYGSSYKRLDSEEWVGQKRKSVRQLIAKAKPPITLAMGADGDVHELVRAADVAKVLPKETVRETAESARHKAEAKRREAKERLRAQAVSLAVATAVQKASKLGSKLVPLLVRALIRSAWDDSCQAIMRSRGLEKKKGGFRGAQAAVLALASTLPDDELAGLGLEMALRKFAPTRYGAADPEWRETLQALNIDFAGIERLLANQAKTKATAKKTPRAKNPAKNRKASKS